MTRKLAFVLLGCLALAACGRGNLATGYLPAERAVAVDGQEPQIFSYNHWLSLAMKQDAVKQRFEQARDRCLLDAALRCKLIAAHLTTGAYDDSDAVSAEIAMALPHDKVQGFEDALARGAEVRARSTNAESVEAEANDTDKKVAQLTRYRDGLNALAKRPNLAVADFIHVQSELAKTEADLAAALSAQRDVKGRIARDRLTVVFAGRRGMTAPLGQVWNQAGDLFVSSAASALQFLIQSVPWLPIVAVAFFLFRWLWRIARRRPAVADSR